MDQTVAIGKSVGAAALRERGDLVLAVEGGFASLEFSTAESQLLAAVPTTNIPTRMNDGAVDPCGRFFAGTMGYKAETGAGTLYQLDATLTVRAILESVTVSNGIGWSPDGQVMYYIDSSRRALDAFDFSLESGTITNRRQVTAVAVERALPDGLSVDADGCIWIALWGGSAVHKYSPDGAHEASIEVPVTQVTSCCFGGPRLNDLYITTARVGLGEDELRRQPYAGGIFVAPEAGVGVASTLFAG